MDFSRRRFLTIAGASATLSVVPILTHDAIAVPLIQEIPDKYALLSSKVATTIDEFNAIKSLFPGSFSSRILSHPDESIQKLGYDKEINDRIYAWHGGINEWFKILEDNFQNMPTHDQVQNVIRRKENILQDLSQTGLEEVAEQVLPVSLLKNLLCEHNLPINPRRSPNFDLFAKRYSKFLVSLPGA